MALNISRVTVGPDWTLLNATDALTVQFQARGAGTVEIIRGTTTAPDINAPSFEIDPKFGQSPAAIEDVILAPTGGRLWARSLTGAVVIIAWTTA